MNDWTLVYDTLDPDAVGLREALCTLGNGYFATRGAATDRDADGVNYPGTYVAGLYDRQTSMVSGHAVENEDLVNLPNWLVLRLRIDGEAWLRFDEMEVLGHRQALCLRTGVLSRDLRVRDPAGRTLGWRERRLVSMADKHMAALEVTITAEDWAGRLEILSALDGTVINDNVARYRKLERRHLDPQEAGPAGEDAVFLRTRTRQSRIEVTEAARTRLIRDGRPLPASRETRAERDWIGQTLTLDLERGEGATVEKVVALHTSRDLGISEPALAAVQAVARAGGFDDLLAPHAAAWARLWDDFDMVIEMPSLNAAEMKLRLHVFHLLQTVCENSMDEDVGVPARGWHGEAYRGHIFWDELFILPFLNYRRPLVTRALLKYRRRRLDAARRHAKAEGFEGALYPWQSGSDGREETQVLHLNPKSGKWIPDNSRRQRHVNAAIAYNIWRYFEVTDDLEFMQDYGAEMFLEIAKFWASAATWSEEKGRYRILEVMGPDEFQTAYPGIAPEDQRGIDDNAYTNVMASFVLRQAADVADLLTPRLRRALCASIGVCDDDLARWDEISRRLYVPFHGDGIISQFAGYEALEEFDWQGYEEKYGDIHRLDRLLEAEGDDPNRYKASKQADVLMLFLLFSTEELIVLFERLGYRFEPECIPRNVEHYLARTSHGSTLSHVVHSWVLARADRPMAWDLLQSALDADLIDIQGGTTPEGIHLGAMAGTVDIFHRCLLGLESRGDILHLNPMLPDELDRLRVRIHYRSHSLQITATPELVEIASEPATAAPIRLAYRGHFRLLASGGTVSFRLIERPARRTAPKDEAGRRALTQAAS